MWIANLFNIHTIFDSEHHINAWLLLFTGAFYLYGGLSVAGFIFLFLMLPETKGVSLEEVESLFLHPWWKDVPGSTEKHTVQYVHIRGMNHAYAADDSDDDSRWDCQKPLK